jgi:JmjC domain
LSRLISVPAESFAETNWGKAPLLARATNPDSHADLFSLAAADEILSVRGLRTPFIRVAKDGAIVASSRYTGPGGAGASVADQVVDDRVLSLFAEGHTVVLQGLHRLWPPIVHFAGDLGAELGHPVQVNAYITPAGSQGFSAHYDVHDVFVLQIAGSKRWIVHPPAYPDPLRTQPWTDRRQAVVERAREEPLLDEVLVPGDTVYLPRGYIHSAEAIGGTCIHLTVGIQPYTRHALVEAMAELMAGNASLRQSLPLGIDPGNADDIASDVALTADAMIEWLGRVDPAELARALGRQAGAAMRPAPLAPLAQAEELARIGPDTILLPRGHLRVWVQPSDGEVTVTLPGGGSSTFPAELAAALAALLVDGVPVSLREIEGLGEEDVLAAARRIMQLGLAVTAA